MTDTAATGGANPGIVPKWTTGRWAIAKFHENGFFGNAGEAMVTSDESRICAVNCVAPFKRGDGYIAQCEERDANARLIAAAPALYEALAFMANVARMTPGFSPMAIKQADAAFFKARGEA